MTYLDTHIVVWLYEGQLKRLSREAAREIDRAASLLISPAVELELSYLYRRNRVKATPDAIVSDLRARIGLAVCDLPFPLVSREAQSLTWTDDLFDRLIVAQASATRSPLVTADGQIKDHYPLVIW
ncbi:MAG: PIN domain-containing protein [Bryobacteraceae bacterium]|nr:PIN domain-containing protein [Bryobacteraceae bacterium]